MKRKMYLPGLVIGVLVSSIIMFFVESYGAKYNYSSIGDDIDRFGDVYEYLLGAYVEEIPPEKLSELVVDSINELLGRLDPYSMLAYKRVREDLKIQTTGEYGGLGIFIQKRSAKDWPTVMEVFPGSPAEKSNLRMGDRVVEIDGEPTLNLDIDEIVGRLRGKPKDPVNMKIMRDGVSGYLDIKVIRDNIVRHNVTYTAVLDGDTGYIKLDGFTDGAVKELKDSINVLNRKDIKGLILDLRGNPGGMLAEAQNISGLFLEKGNVVVTTRGRAGKNEHRYNVEDNPVLSERPLIVLINRGSASASEIVAGAIQDWDRGLCLGDTTFGKGSVQTLFNFSDTRSSLKLTTAYYYTPSGRRIHREDNETDEDAGSEELDEPDKERELNGGKTEFYTKKYKRPVYGGGGIAPDILVKMPELTHFPRSLIMQGTAFKFAVHYANAHQDITEDFEVDDSVLNEFAEFIKDEDHFKYKPPGMDLLDEFEKVIETEKINTVVQEELKNLKSSLKARQDKDFSENKDEIRRLVKREIFTSFWHQRGRVMANMNKDPQILEALKIIKDPGLYNSYLKLGALSKK